MRKLYACLDKWSPWFLSLLRIVIAALFVCHGTQKILGYPTTRAELPDLDSAAGIAGIIETVFGSLVLLGLLTRPAAFILSGEMAVAYFMVHFPRGWWPIHNLGEPAVVYSFIFLYFVAAGAGPVSLDRLIAKKWGKPSE